MIVDTAPKDKHDFGSVHDALTEVDGWSQRQFTDKELTAICNALPKRIQLKAVEWGWNDTEVRDEIFVWARDHKDAVEHEVVVARVPHGSWPFPTGGRP